MQAKKAIASTAIMALVVLGAYSRRGYVWSHSLAGAPDASDLLASQPGDYFILPDEDVPLSGLPGELTPVIETPDSRLMELVNAERSAAKLDALAELTDLSQAAVVRAGELLESFSHTRPDGGSYKTALDEQGVGYRFTGENIAGGYATAEDAVQAWMGSDGFRENILNPDYRQMGVGYCDDDQGMRYGSDEIMGKSPILNIKYLHY